MNTNQIDISNQFNKFLADLSSLCPKKIPTPIELANQLGITRQAIYRWMHGDMTSSKIALALNEATGSQFPAKLTGQNVYIAKQLFALSYVPGRYRQ